MEKGWRKAGEGQKEGLLVPITKKNLQKKKKFRSKEEKDPPKDTHSGRSTLNNSS